jgi:hypothetical protein
VVVNGNVRDWSITRNHIFRNDNIGIDAIGFEGKAPRDDQARAGVIADNVVTDIDSLGNPAYDEEGGGNCRCADAIYVDGGRDLLIERNILLRSNIALEIASEHSFGSASNVLARDNLLAGQHHDRAGHGRLRHGARPDRQRARRQQHAGQQRHAGNGLRRDPAPVPRLRLADPQQRGRRQRPGDHDRQPYVENAGNVVDGNDWWVVGARPATATWQWKNETYQGFAAYRRAHRQ